MDRERWDAAVNTPELLTLVGAVAGHPDGDEIARGVLADYLADRGDFRERVVRHLKLLSGVVELFHHPVLNWVGAARVHECVPDNLPGDPGVLDVEVSGPVFPMPRRIVDVRHTGQFCMGSWRYRTERTDPPSPVEIFLSRPHRGPRGAFWSGTVGPKRSVGHEFFLHPNFQPGGFDVWASCRPDVPRAEFRLKAQFSVRTAPQPSSPPAPSDPPDPSLPHDVAALLAVAAGGAGLYSPGHFWRMFGTLDPPTGGGFLQSHTT